MRLGYGLLGTCFAITLVLGCGGDDDDSGSTKGGAGQTGGAGQASKSTAQCDDQACLACFNSGGGADCADECKGCEDDGNGGGGNGSAGNDSGSGGSNAEMTGGKQPECASDDDCGISFECLACGLTDSQGWCFQTKACKFDGDCGVGNKCGYNVKSSEYRCLPADTCE
jgi:hypothetical protein